MTKDLAAWVREIRECADRKTPTSQAIVNEGLDSKWEGVQSVALQVLGAWGDPESRTRLREFEEHASSLRVGWSIHGVAVRSLAGCVTAEDAPWVLDRYFSREGVIAKHVFLPVVLALPPDAARERLLRESASSDRDNRQAAMKALAHLGYPDTADLMATFLDDEDDEIRRGAKWNLERLTQGPG